MSEQKKVTDGFSVLYVFLVLWMAYFGVWPLAEPEHYERTFWGILDVAVHLVGVILAVKLFIVAMKKLEEHALRVISDE